MSAASRWVACTAVRGRPEHAGVGQHLGRRAAVGGPAVVVLGRLLGQVHVQRPGTRRPRAPGAARPAAPPAPSAPRPRRRPGRPPPARAQPSNPPAANRRCTGVRVPADARRPGTASPAAPAGCPPGRPPPAPRRTARAGSGTRRPRSSRRTASRCTPRWPARGSAAGSSRPASVYIACRQVQNVPPSPWVRPRSARWNAWLCALASPGSTSPASRCAPGGAATPLVSAVITPSRCSTSTPAAGAPSSQASSHQKAVTAAASRRSTVASALHAGRAVVGFGVLLGRVADPGRVPHEDHPGRDVLGQDAGVVPGAGGHLRRRRRAAAASSSRSPAGKSTRPLADSSVTVDRAALARGQPLGRGRDLGHRGPHLLVGVVPAVQPEVHSGRDHVGAARGRLQPADGGPAAPGGGDLADREHRRRPRPASGPAGRPSRWCRRGCPAR